MCTKIFILLCLFSLLVLVGCGQYNQVSNIIGSDAEYSDIEVEQVETEALPEDVTDITSADLVLLVIDSLDGEDDTDEIQFSDDIEIISTCDDETNEANCEE